MTRPTTSSGSTTDGGGPNLLWLAAAAVAAAVGTGMIALFTFGLPTWLTFLTPPTTTRAAATAALGLYASLQTYNHIRNHTTADLPASVKVASVGSTVMLAAGTLTASLWWAIPFGLALGWSTFNKHTAGPTTQ